MSISFYHDLAINIYTLEIATYLDINMAQSHCDNKHISYGKKKK